MIPTARMSSLFLALAGVAIVAAAAIWWFARSDESLPIGDTSASGGDIAAAQAEARRKIATGGSSQPIGEESGRDRVEEKGAGSTGGGMDAGTISADATAKRLVLSIRFSDVDAATSSAYSLEVDASRSIQGRSSIAFSMPADGSPAEVDVTALREAFEEVPGFVIRMSRGFGGSYASVEFRHSLDALDRLVDDKRDVFDVVLSLGVMAIVKGRLLADDQVDARRRAEVRAYRGAHAAGLAAIVVPAFNDGSFHLHLDRRTRWTIVCTAMGHTLLSLDVPPHGRPVRELGDQTLSRGESISGRVTRQGVPQAGFVVRAVLESRGRPFEESVEIGRGRAVYVDGRLMWCDVTTTTDSDGSYRIQGLDRRRYEVTVESLDGGEEEVHESLRSRLSREIVASASGVDFELASVELKISVRDESGPLREWLLSLTTPDGKAWSGTALDEAGVRIVHLPTEAHADVVVEHRGYETYRGKISLPLGSASVAYDVVMTPIADARLSVRVRDHEALGIHCLLAVVKSPIDHEVPIPRESSPNLQRALAPMYRTADVDADDRFAFEDFRLRKGRHEIVFRALGPEMVSALVPSTVAVDVDPQRETVLEIAFERGGFASLAARKGSSMEIDGKAILRDSNGVDIRKALFWITPRGLAFHSDSPFQMETDRSPDARFSRTREPLLPGRYRIDFEADDGTKRSADFEIRAGETTDVIVDF